MCNLICVTNRHLCRENFLQRLEKIAALRPRAIILREKDLSADDYEKLAANVMKICRAHDVELILHSFVDVAINLCVKKIHLPFADLKTFEPSKKIFFRMIGASCHSLEEARFAENFGCNYIIAGHIFQTDCKKNLKPRGLKFLEQIVRGVKIPVWAIGGINQKNFRSVLEVGAENFCLMSSLMRCT